MNQTVRYSLRDPADGVLLFYFLSFFFIPRPFTVTDLEQRLEIVKNGRYDRVHGEKISLHLVES